MANKSCLLNMMVLTKQLVSKSHSAINTHAHSIKGVHCTHVHGKKVYTNPYKSMKTLICMSFLDLVLSSQKKERILAFSDLLPKSVISNNIQHHFTRLLIWRFTPFPLITVPATGPHPYFEMQRGPVDCNVINEPMKLNVLNRSVWSHRWYLNCEVAP